MLVDVAVAQTNEYSCPVLLQLRVNASITQSRFPCLGIAHLKPDRNEISPRKECQDVEEVSLDTESDVALFVLQDKLGVSFLIRDFCDSIAHLHDGCTNLLIPR